MGCIKFPESGKFSYFRQSHIYETLAPELFDYEDSKSERWPRAEKIREVYSVNKSTSRLLFVIKNHYFDRQLKTTIKTNLETLKGENCFEVSNNFNEF